MSRRLKYNVDTGEYYWSITEDVQKMKDHAKFKRDKEQHFGIRKDASYVHLCGLSEGVCLQIKDKYGIDPANMAKGQQQKLLQIIQRDYPQLLYTNMKVG